MEESVILVEGESDKAALDAAARVLAIDISSAPILVMGGATNVVRFLAEAVAAGVGIAGLYDAAEETHIVRALAGVGLTDGRTQGELAEHGFFVCDPDLEGELIAAMGPDHVLTLIEQQGLDQRRLRTMRQQPEWRGRSLDDQLRRWFGSGGSRKIRYASLLVEAMEPDQLPRPLVSVLHHAVGGCPDAVV